MTAQNFSSNETMDFFDNCDSSLDDFYTIRGFDTCKGNFKILPEKLTSIMLSQLKKKDEGLFNKYRLVTQRSQFSTLYFDFDFKDREHYSKNPQKMDTFTLYDKIENQITDYLIINIINTINEFYDDANVEYIICDKVKGKGIHLYFPFVVVSMGLHKQICNSVMEKLTSTKKFLFEKEDWETVFDDCVDHQCLALPYFKNSSGDYYRFNIERSTFPLKDCNERSRILKCFTNIKEELPKIPNLKPTVNMDIINEISKPKIKVSKDGKQNKLTPRDENLDAEGQEKLIIDHLNNLDVSKYSDNKNWLKVVTILTNYGLVNEAIEWSKKVSGFDPVVSVNRIYSLAKAKIPNNHLTKSTLFKLSKVDNRKGYFNIRKKYSRQLKNTDEILQIDIKYDVEVTEGKISDETIKNCVDFIVNGGKTIMINGAPSIGKTTAVRRIIYEIENQWEKKLNIFCSVSRRSMDGTLDTALNTPNDTFKHLPILNVQSYLNSKDFKNRYISSLEHLAEYNDPDSLFFGSTKKRCPSYDICIIDECNSQLRHLYSPTVYDRKKSLENLLTIAKKSDIVILMDAQVTNICHSFIEENIECFGRVLKYRNHTKPKKGTNMIIYNIDDRKRTQDEYLVEFCETKIKDAILNKKSVYIASDSKDCVDKIFNILRSMYDGTDALNYFAVFTREKGLQSEILDINKFAQGKCLIVSPRIVYAVDISKVHYDDIFGIYTHTGEEEYMDALQLNQQIARCRDVNGGTVHILDLDYDYEERELNYVSFEQHVKDMEEEYKKYLLFQKTILKVNSEIESDLVGRMKYKFNKTHLVKTYQDRILNTCKMHFLEMIAKEEGYKVSHQILKLKNSEDDIKNIKESVKKYKLLRKQDKKEVDDVANGIIQISINKNIIRDVNNEVNRINDIFELDKDIKEDERIGTNLREELFNNASERGMKTLDVTCKDKKRLEGFQMRQTYLNKSPEEVRKYIGMSNKKNIDKLAPESIKIFHRIEALENIEKSINMKRFDINNISGDFDTIKKGLLKCVDDFVIVYDDVTHRMRNEKTIKGLIEKINSVYDVQNLLVKSCYNRFGTIFLSEEKRIRANGEDKIIKIFKLAD